MQELDMINTWLGGHAITLVGLRHLIGSHQTITVCEIGCGGGDNLVAIRHWCTKKGIAASFLGIDINPDCTTVAAGKELPNARWITADYKTVQFDEKPDIIFSSLFCHHFPERELITQLQWMRDNVRLGFFINDLHRHPLAYYSIRWLTRLLGGSYLVQHDAPLSVARGFVKNDWYQLFDSAGITNFSVQWKWAFRWLVVKQHDPYR